MATLGSIFLTTALSSLHFARVNLLGRRVPVGLAELSADKLNEQLRLGISNTAARAGVRVRDVEALLPMARFAELGARIGSLQPYVLSSWEDQPVESRRSSDLGLLTEGGRMRDVPAALVDLAEMAGEDTELGQTLQRLSEAVGEWQELILRGGNTFDDLSALGAAYRRRAIRRAIVALLVVAVGAAGFAVWLRGARARDRVDANIAADDPCSVSAVEPGDLELASDQQRAAIEARSKECKDRRDKAEKERLAKRRHQEHLARCAGFARQVAARQAPAAIEELGAHQLGLWVRVASGKLTEADLGPKDPSIPCGDTPAKTSLQASFDAAVAASRAWIDAPELSPRVNKLLADNASKLPAEVKAELADRAEKDAAKALQDPDRSKRGPAQRLCRLQRLVGIRPKPFCRALQ